jgi:NAD(P)-dependent dehydrogenase (short-subunit alcohol dehydrogenase family)
LRPAHLVNNARDLANLRADASASQRAQWVAEYTLGVVVPVELSLALAESSDSALASVINISSIYGMVAANPALYGKPADRPPMHYGVTKAALLHLTKELAVRLAPKVRVNAITYGGIEGRADDDFKHRYGSLTPLKRMMRPDEVFGPLEFLISDGATSVTGHNLVADGGWTLW